MVNREEMKERLMAAAKKAGVPLDDATVNKMIEETPMVRYSLDCGHGGKSYAVVVGDCIFCEACERKSRAVHVK